jgi:BNR repeat-like domain
MNMKKPAPITSSVPRTGNLRTEHARAAIPWPALMLARLAAVALLLNGPGILAQTPDFPARPAHPGAVFRTALPTLSAAGKSGGSSGSSTTTPPRTTATPASFSGTSYTVGSTVTPTTTVPEAEEHIAVDPNNPSTLVAAISDFSLTELINGTPEQHNTTKYAVSRNNGDNWQESFVPLDASSGLRTTSDGLAWEANSDPVVAIDKSGHVYLADLYFNVANNDNGFYVSVDDAINDSDGVTFTADQTYPVAKNLGAAATYTFEDKPWIAVDNSQTGYPGNVYVSWTHFFAATTSSGNGHHQTSQSSASDAVVFSRSTDHGQTWSSMAQVSPATQDDHVQGSQVAVGPDGTVYVVWMLLGSSLYNGGQDQLFLCKSSDGGQTFSQPVAISPPFNGLSFSSTYRTASWPALAAGSSGIFVAYADQPSANSRIEFIASSDGGATFSGPVALDDDKDGSGNPVGQRLMPALAVDETGTIHCSWFDTRNSPDGTAQYYDIYATYSTDAGVTFAPNTRVTAMTINAGSADFLGDYSGIAAAGGHAHPAWTIGSDASPGANGGLQTASLILPTTSDFAISVSPSEESVAPGSSASYTVTIKGSLTFDASSPSVTFGLTGSPSDAVLSFSPASLTGSGSSDLTVSSSTLGSYPLTITATSGALTHSATVWLDVQNPDFSLSVSPVSISVPALVVANGTGTPSWKATYAIDINRAGGFSDPVNLSVGPPAGATAAFNPASAVDSSTLTITGLDRTKPDTYNLTITGTDSGGLLSDPSRTAPATLIVSSSPTTVSVVSPSGTIGYGTTGGSTGTKNLTVTVALLDNFAQPAPSATVSSTLTLTSSSGTTPYYATGTTGADGTVTFILRNAPAGYYSCKVTAVTASGLTWDGLTPPNSYTLIK